jgi:hypothetical protein
LRISSLSLFKAHHSQVQSEQRLYKVARDEPAPHLAIASTIYVVVDKMQVQQSQQLVESILLMQMLLQAAGTLKFQFQS